MLYLKGNPPVFIVKITPKKSKRLEMIDQLEIRLNEFKGFLTPTDRETNDRIRNLLEYGNETFEVLRSEIAELEAELNSY